MARSIEAQLVITAKDQTGAALDAVGRKLDAVGKKAAAIDRAARQMSRTTNVASAVDGRAARAGVISRAGGALDRAASVGGARLVGAAGALVGGLALRDSITRYAEVERRMTRIGITADATRAEMRALTAEAQKMAYDLAIPFEKIADGFDALAAQGKTLAQMRGMMPSVASTAQASGADVADIAKSAGALSDHLGITPGQMQSGFDVLVGGGKAGQFELKDMARYLPAIAPQAAAVGMRGLGGLRELVAVAQTVRRGSGSSEEAASSMSNIFAKMESEETAKRFAKFGVDLRKEMAQARKEGKNLLDVFTQLSDKALKGDLSKLPQLFSDMEFARGMRALMSLPGYLKQVRSELQNVDGATMKDLNRVLEDTQTKVDRASVAWDRLKTTIGATIDQVGGSWVMGKAADKLSAFGNDIETFRNNPSAYMRRWENWDRFGIDTDRDPDEIQRERDAKAADERFTSDYSNRIVDLEKARNDFRELNGRGPRPRFRAEEARAQAKLDELLGARGAYDDTKHQLAAVVAARGLIADARINNAGSPRPITPGLLSFGLGGYPVGANTFGAVPTAVKARAETAPARAPSLEKLEDIFTSGQVKADVHGQAEITIRLEPTGAFLNLVKGVERLEQMALSNGPGSRGGGQAGAVPGRFGGN